jgi:hypothetical protein
MHMGISPESPTTTALCYCHRHANDRQFEAEIAARLVGGEALPTSVVVGVLGWHTPAHAGLADASGHTEEAESTPCATHPVYDSYPYVLVMERAERSLHDACCKERLAGYDMAGVHIVLLAVLCCLAALHARRVIHGDLKQRNVIRRGAQGWILCDVSAHPLRACHCMSRMGLTLLSLAQMDASAHIGAPVGDKTSTAYCPPELARVRFAALLASLPLASTSFDVWSFGVMVCAIARSVSRVSTRELARLTLTLTRPSADVALRDAGGARALQPRHSERRACGPHRPHSALRLAHRLRCARRGSRPCTCAVCNTFL